MLDVGPFSATHIQGRCDWRAFLGSPALPPNSNRQRLTYGTLSERQQVLTLGVTAITMTFLQQQTDHLRVPGARHWQGSAGARTDERRSTCLWQIRAKCMDKVTFISRFSAERIQAAR
jgi:hypothetical protein